MSPGRSWSLYVVGQRAGPLLVLELVKRARTQTETRYLVEWTCCGRHEVLTHAMVYSRVIRANRTCLDCSRERATGRPRRDAEQGWSTEPGVVDLAGQYWPALGRMGPRFGAQPQ